MQIITHYRMIVLFTVFSASSLVQFGEFSYLFMSKDKEMPLNKLKKVSEKFERFGISIGGEFYFFYLLLMKISGEISSKFGNKGYIPQWAAGTLTGLAVIFGIVNQEFFYEKLKNFRGKSAIKNLFTSTSAASSAQFYCFSLGQMILRIIEKAEGAKLKESFENPFNTTRWIAIGSVFGGALALKTLCNIEENHNVSLFLCKKYSEENRITWKKIFKLTKSIGAVTGGIIIPASALMFIIDIILYAKENDSKYEIITISLLLLVTLITSTSCIYNTCQRSHANNLIYSNNNQPINTESELLVSEPSMQN